MSSGSGTVDGSGDNHGQITKVCCSRCNTENAIQMGDVQYTSIHKFVICKSCEEEVILGDDWVGPGTTSESTSDRKSLLGQSEAAEGGGGQEEGVKRPVGLRQRGRNRKLKSSASFTECGSERNDDSKAIPQSTSLGTIVQNGDGLTEDSLKQLSRIIKDQPCPHCGCTDRNLLNRVEGVRDVFYCHSCERPYGIDDGMNFFDFQEFLSTGYRMDPCSVCGNDDPEKFTLERSSGQADHETGLVVRCSVCETVSLSGLGQMVEVKEETGEVTCAVECCSCGNRDSQKFKDHLDAGSSTVETICMICKKRNVTKVSGKVCSCKDASVDYAFDDFGYIGEIKCNACGAVMDVKDDDSRKKASSDGTSRGRTRIRSLDMIRSGDHIAWHQSLGYWHHAIVIEVNFSLINLVHYNGPSTHKGEIVDEWIELDLTKEEVYRINYDRDARTFDPKVVIERAKSRVGEHSYNLMTNNCEHFARWCVTGQHRSIQVQTFWGSIVSRVKVVSQGTAVRSLSKMGLNLVRKGGATGEATKSAASGVSSASGLTAGFAVGYEIYSVVTDIRQAHRQRVDGAIDRSEFLKITIKRSCEGVGSLVGTAVTLAIPLTSNAVGLTIGALIGKAAGAMVGRNAALLIDKASSKKS